MEMKVVAEVMRKKEKHIYTGRFDDVFQLITEFTYSKSSFN